MATYQFVEAYDQQDVLITATDLGIVVSLYPTGLNDDDGQHFMYVVEDGKLVPGN